MAKMQVLIEFWEFLRFNKKYWMLPIVVVLVFVLAFSFSVPWYLLNYPSL